MELAEGRRFSLPPLRAVLRGDVGEKEEEGAEAAAAAAAEAAAAEEEAVEEGEVRPGNR